MQLSDVGGSLRRHWVLTLVLLLLIPVVVTAYLLNRQVITPPARYTTSADVLIPARDKKTGERPPNVPPVLLQGQVELATSVHTQDVALSAANLPVPSPDILFAARLNEDKDVITLVVAAPKPEVAAIALNEYVVAFADGRRQSVQDAALNTQDIDVRVIGVLNKELSDILSKLGPFVPLPDNVPDNEPVPVPPGVSTDTALLLYQRNAIMNEILRFESDYAQQSKQTIIPGDFTTVVQRRGANRITPPPPSPLAPVLAIIAVGLLLAVGIPVAIDRIDSSISDSRAAGTALRARVLGTIPAMSRRMQHQLVPPGSTWDASFRSLAATSISTDQLPKAIMVTSPKGAMQDAVAANFASALAGLGLTVALVGTVPRQKWFLTGRDDSDDETNGTEGSSKKAKAKDKDKPAADAKPGADAATEPVAVVTEPLPPTYRTFPELLEDAHAGRLSGNDVRSAMAVSDVANLFVVPPGEDEIDLSLDGLPTLLDAMSRGDIDIAVVAGPALLEDPNATIIAWSTRNVLWALEIGHVNGRDAHLAADRLEIAGVEPFGIAVVNRN